MSFICFYKISNGLLVGGASVFLMFLVSFEDFSAAFRGLTIG